MNLSSSPDIKGGGQLVCCIWYTEVFPFCGPQESGCRAEYNSGIKQFNYKVSSTMQVQL
jgi:hypothetical protein